MAEVPKDRKYTMRPAWKRAYNKLMKVYAEFEAHDSARDVSGWTQKYGMTKKESMARINLAKRRIAHEREKYKTYSTKALRKLYQDWKQEDYKIAFDRSKKI